MSSEAAGAGAALPAATLPAWLAQPQDYEPARDRERFLTRTFLQLSGALAQLRLDDGRVAPWSASPQVKLLFGLGVIVLNSLSANFLFTLVLLAGVLVRAALLPARALRRVAGVACGAAGLTFVLMLPAVFLGQPRAALTLGTKALVSVGVAMEVALSTPAGQLSAGLRALHVPAGAILTLELALRSIVSLGQVALEALTALRLRSVGRNRSKAASLGGVGGVVFVKAARNANDTYDAMRCRCFTGRYDVGAPPRPGLRDLAWGLLLVALVALFAYLEGAQATGNAAGAAWAAGGVAAASAASAGARAALASALTGTGGLA